MFRIGEETRCWEMGDGFTIEEDRIVAAVWVCPLMTVEIAHLKFMKGEMGIPGAPVSSSSSSISNPSPSSVSCFL